MSDIPIYPIEDAEGNPAAVQVYENGVFHNNGNPVGCVTEEDAIAQKFDTTASFAKGTYCMQNHKMQKFKAAKSAGAWDSSKADQTTVGNELTQLNSTLTNRIITSVTADGVKTYRKIMSELYASISSLPEAKIRMSMLCVGVNNMPCTAYSSGSFIVYSKSTVASNSVSNSAYNLRSAENSNEFFSATQTTSTLTIEDKSAQIPSSGTVFSVIGIV